jgi:DNA helicase HerA-like ATPase
VSIFTLDEESSRRRKVTFDFTVRIGYDEIQPEDISLLRQTLNLTETAVNGVYSLARKFGNRKWLEATLALDDSDDTKELLNELKIEESTYRNLRRGLDTISRLPFLVPHTPDNAVQSMLEYLQRGINVVLEFGRFTDITAYILVANLLTRRIYNTYRERTEQALGDDAAQPRPLVITIEEAHRFLNPEIAGQTIFGLIAREMRKYNVTLLIIDQRPSGIDEDVMSQLGTKITCLLDNEKDIDSVLAGVSGKSELKSVLARLESRQQALIFGHAVPMPVVIKVREWGSAQSYAEFASAAPSEKQVKKDIEDLWK